MSHHYYEDDEPVRLPCAVCSDYLRYGEMVCKKHSIKEWQREAFETMQSVGFGKAKRPDIWKYVGNIMAEASEMWECLRQKDFKPNKKWYREDGKPEGLGPEMADLCLRVLNMAETFGIDLQAEMAEKNAFNKTRPKRHGGKRA